MKQKPKSKTVEEDAYAERAKVVTDATLKSINIWKQIAQEKMLVADKHPLGWKHGVEMVTAVDALEEAYLVILGTMERHFIEIEHFGEPKTPVSHN